MVPSATGGPDPLVSRRATNGLDHPITIEKPVLRAFTGASAGGTDLRCAGHHALSANSAALRFRPPMLAAGTAIITTALFLTDFVAARSLSGEKASLPESVIRDTSAIVEDDTAPNALTHRESGLIDLTDNMPVSGLSGEPGDTRDYYIDVGAGTRTLVVTLDVGSGDPDLYVSQIFPPSA